MHLLKDFHFCPVCGSSCFAEHNERSKHCETCGFVYYINPRAAVAAFIKNENNELLVCRRAKDPARDTLDLPGGFTDCFETAEEAVIREVQEETGLQVTYTRYLFSLPNIYRYSGIDIHTLDLFFYCQVASTESLSAADDVAQSMFIPLSEIQPEYFGLSSIKKAVEIYVEMHSSSNETRLRGV